MPDSTAHAAASPAAAPPAAPSDFASLAVREFSSLGDTVTLDEWLRTHPSDSLRNYRYGVDRDADDRWCARAVSRGLASDSTFVRYAYFYPPGTPADLSLPAENPNLVREQCRLGAIWLQTRTRNPDKIVLAELLRDSLTRAYGTGERELGRDVGFNGSAYWDHIGWWQSATTTIVSLHDQGLGGQEPPRVVAFAYRAAVQFAQRSSELQVEDAEDRRDFALTIRAARLSQIDSARGSRLMAAFAAAEKAYNTTESGDRARAQAQTAARAVRTGLTDWLTASKNLAPVQRAAALVAADQLLGSSAIRYVFANNNEGTEKVVQAFGAEFAPDQLGGGNAYRHSFLDSAERLDSAGPAGRLATLAWLRIGFNRGMCAGTDSASQRVGVASEQLLKDSSDSLDSFELHVLAGDGYADLVALASGRAMEYADTTEFVSAVAQARPRAIQHYRQALGFARQTTSGEARAVWLKAWRLLAGLPPNDLRFFCIYD